MSRDTAKFVYFCVLICLSFQFSSCGVFSKKEEVANEKAGLYYSHGTSELINQNYTKALDALLKAYALSPNDSKIANNLGMAYFFKKDAPKAIELINKSLELDPENADARNNLASIYFQKGNFQAAREQYQKIRENLVYLHQYRVLYNLALIELKQGRIEEAQNFLTLSLKERHDYCPAHFQLGLIYNQKFKYTQALESFKEASRGTCYNEPAPHFQQAISLIKIGDQLKAKAKLEEIKQLFPNSPYPAMIQNEMEGLKNTTEVGIQQAAPLELENRNDTSWDLDEEELKRKLEKLESSRL